MDRTMHVRTCFATLLILPALLVAACGGGGANTGDPTSRVAESAATTAAVHPTSSVADPSHGAGYISTAEAICERLKAEVLPDRSEGLQEIIRIAPQNEALEQRAVSELSKIAPPPALAREWTQFLAIRGLLARQLGTLAVTGKRYEARALEELRAAKPHTRNLQQLQELLAGKAHAQAHALERVIAAKKRAHSSLRVVAAHLGLSTCARVG
jgi:hypothetical protein